ncbi:hypothetical protein AB7281_14740 [Providencia rettgeri]
MNNRFVPPIPPNGYGFTIPRSKQEFIEQQNFFRNQYERSTGVSISNQSQYLCGVGEMQSLQNPHKQ